MLRQMLFIPILCIMGNDLVRNERTPLPQFSAVFKVEAAGKPIECTTGHAAPFEIDFDGDGRKAIVIGEFDKGRARVYLNTGSDNDPKFDAFTYLQAGGHDASVTPFCCIGFDPYFVDLNGDGILDVTSGDYSGGGINFYEGTGNKGLAFKEGLRLQQPELGDTVFLKDTKNRVEWLMRTANFSDYDNDGDYDMIFGNQEGTVLYAENKGTKKNYKFARSIKMAAAGQPIKVDGKSDPLPVDWDDDRIIDLLVGAESGDVVFFKGKVKGGTDFEQGVSIWAGQILTPGVKPSYASNIKSLDAMGQARPYPGYRIRLGVADWNNDGKMDLLVGNCYDNWYDQPKNDSYHLFFSAQVNFKTKHLPI